MEKNRTEVRKKSFISNFKIIILEKDGERRAWVSNMPALLLSLTLIVGGIAWSAMSFTTSVVQAEADSTSVDVWWPTNGAKVSGSQPFKAIVQGLSPDQYEMFWYVDGDKWNWMDNDNTDHPHKEAKVDLSNWNWKGEGPYKVTFVARQNGNVIGERTVEVRVEGNSSASEDKDEKESVSRKDDSKEEKKVEDEKSNEESTPAIASVGQIEVSEPHVSYAENSGVSGDLYVNKNNPAATQANSWRSSRPEDAKKMDIIAAQPQAVWLGGWNTNVEQDVRTTMNNANAEGKTAVFILYNIPHRDCGGYSAGGVAELQYSAWVQSVANGIGNGKAIVILEPDALAAISCLSGETAENRLSLIRGAIDTLKKNSNTKVYLDAGHSGWQQGSSIAETLKKAGIAKADGFFLNISNFRSTDAEVAYGTEISKLTGGKHFIIDTSRNGNGPNGVEWCNPAGRAIGQPPTTNTGNLLVDAFIWGKIPGESDGNCNGGPNAGQWWPEYALGLVTNSR